MQVHEISVTTPRGHNRSGLVIGSLNFAKLMAYQEFKGEDRDSRIEIRDQSTGRVIATRRLGTHRWRLN